jgi:hypothetical protein
MFILHPVNSNLSVIWDITAFRLPDAQCRQIAGDFTAILSSVSRLQPGSSPAHI